MIIQISETYLVLWLLIDRCEIESFVLFFLLRYMANVCVGITQQVITVSDVIVSITTDHGDQQVA